MAEPIIVTENLGFTYPPNGEKLAFPVFENLSVTIDRGSKMIVGHILTCHHHDCYYYDSHEQDMFSQSFTHPWEYYSLASLFLGFPVLS